MNKKILLFVFVLLLMLWSEVPLDAQVVFNIPLSLSYSIPFDFTSGVGGVFRRLDVDSTFQLLAEISPVVSIGAEIGMSYTLVAVTSFAVSVGTLLALTDPSYYSLLAAHFPIRFLVTFNIDKVNDVAIDIYSGLQFNLIDNRVFPLYDMTVDVGARFYAVNVFVDVSYALPVSIDFEATPATTGFWNNALTLGFGYRFEIVGG